MKSITLYLALLLTSLFCKVYAQSDFSEKMNELSLKMEKTISDEKELLANQLEAVNNQLSFGTLTAAEAEAKKKQLSTESATRLDEKLAEIDEERNLLIQNKIEGKVELAKSDSTKTKNYTFAINSKNKDKFKYGELRTTTQFVFAIGLNNVVTDGSIANSDYRVYKSRFYEWGFTYNTRLDKNSQLFHIKYGLSLQYNDLRPTDNRYLVDNGETTDLVTSPVVQDDSRFRNVNLVFPVHFELDFSKTKDRDGRKIFLSHDSFRLGIGGYTGFNVKSKQIQKYDVAGYDTRTVTRGDWNTNNFIYGLSGYIGYGQISLYAKYDLNPLFKDNAVDQRNISMGLRFDFN
ncbi:hypothetical protein [Flavobacterium sp.]|uniref:hypothetical protein n=1 Tax=Flavobacterium sp. TaxID=239 RepID=UPI0026319891|nr:hypothetical protein [Flavobacterium sp.]